MPLLANILGFSAFGFGARCFQLGIQKRNIFSRASWAPAGPRQIDMCRRLSCAAAVSRDSS